MSTTLWIIVVIVVLGLIIWALSRKKGKPSLPESQPSPPSETPGI